MAQTHVLAKHLDNHGHLTGPEYEHLITTFPVDAFEELWEPKGWAAVNRAGEPVADLEQANPDRHDPAQAQADASSRAAARAELAQKFTRTPKRPAPAEKVEG